MILIQCCRIDQLYNNRDMFQMLRQAQRPALLTFIGVALIKFATGFIGIWGSINIYFFSYLKNHSVQIRPQTNSLMLLLAILPSSLSVLLASKLTRFVGYKNVISACGIIFSIAPLVINIRINLAVLAVCYLLTPICCFSISSISILNCLWSQFPQHLNKVSGAAVLFFSLGMITWNLIFMAICNPKNLSARIDSNNQPFFQNQITDQIFLASNTVVALAGICYNVGSFLVTKRIDSTKVYQECKKLSQENTVSNSIVVQEVGKVESDLAKQEKTYKEFKGIKKSLLDIKFLLLFCISYLVPLYLIYLVMYMKIIYLPIVNDDHYLGACSITITFAAICGAPFWGFVGDKYGFKKTLLFVTAIDFIGKIVGLFCVQKWNIILVYFFVGFHDKGLLTIIGPGLIEIFGLQLATEIVPYKGLAVFLAYVTVPLTEIIFFKRVGYQMILVVFACCSSVAMGISYYFYSKINYIKFNDSSKIQVQPKQMVTQE